MESSLCISRLENMMKTAKKAEERLICTVLNHIDDINSYTISSLADEAGVSYATVCRMLEKIGISGFKEFKKILSDGGTAEKEKANLNEGTKPVQGVENSAVCARVCDNAEKLISVCRNGLYGEVLDSSVTALHNAGSLMFVGLGASSISARYAYMGFLGLGKQCFFSNDMIMAKMKASLLSKGDVLVAISSSGKTKQIIEAAKIARSSGATVISLSDMAESPLSHVSDISVCTGDGHDISSVEGTIPSIQGQITALSILYECFCEKIKKEKAVMDYE